MQGGPRGDFRPTGSLVEAILFQVVVMTVFGGFCGLVSLLATKWEGFRFPIMAGTAIFIAAIATEPTHDFAHSVLFYAAMPLSGVVLGLVPLRSPWGGFILMVPQLALHAIWVFSLGPWIGVHMGPTTIMGLFWLALLGIIWGIITLATLGLRWLFLRLVTRNNATA